MGPLDAATDSNWTELYDALGGYPTQSNTQTTTITINLASGDSEYGEPNPVPVNSQFLVEVEAIIGFYGRDTAISPSAPYVIFGEASGWSNPQTVSLPSTGQTIPKPSVPEFTVKFVDASYNVAPSSSINPYIGQNVTIEGYHVENRTIELIIKNQPFISYISNGTPISFYLNVREKGHYEENWTTIYNIDNYFTAPSNTIYTTLTYSLDPNAPPWLDNNLPSGGQLDFQVEALIGYIGRNAGFASWYFTGQESGWSNTQTVTIPASSNSALPSSTSITTHAVPEFPLMATPLLLSLLSVAGILGLRKKRRGKH